MARKIEIKRLEPGPFGTAHAASKCTAHFKHYDSTKTHDCLHEELDVSGDITFTDALQGSGSIIEDVVTACKAYVNSAGYRDGQYQSEGWDN